MNFDTYDQGLKLTETAADILESISNEPGVTPVQFYEVLDSYDIVEDDYRELLMQAAAMIELTLELVTDISNPTVH
jgi:hypothetical protein